MNNTTRTSAHSAALVTSSECSRALTPATAAREAALVAGGTAAIALIGQISLPLPFTPVPVTLGTFAVIGMASVLGSRRALASTILFAVLAAAGAPILAGWNSGISATFGYVVGYILVALVAGTASRTHRAASPLTAAAARLPLMLAASALVYVPGLIWLHLATGMTWQATVAAGFLPFIVGDLLKSVVAAANPFRIR